MKVLTLFKKNTKRQTKKIVVSKPPPYLAPEGQFPIHKCTVEVFGEMQMEGQELEETKNQM